MARADKGTSRPDGGPKGTQDIDQENPDTALDQDDLQDDIKGDNKLQGHDQERVRDQRHAQPHASNRTEGVVESFERQDPKARTDDE